LGGTLKRSVIGGGVVIRPIEWQPKSA